jgi:hypothetical protein
LKFSCFFWFFFSLFSPQSESNELDGTISETSLEEFVAPSKTFTVVSNPKKYSAEEVVERAKHFLGYCDYDVFASNCEHFATFCISGAPISNQVEVAKTVGIAAAVVAVGAALAAFLFSSSSSSSPSDRADSPEEDEERDEGSR